jgi:hypothetical protein
MSSRSKIWRGGGHHPTRTRIEGQIILSSTLFFLFCPFAVQSGRTDILASDYAGHSVSSCHITRGYWKPNSMSI